MSKFLDELEAFLKTQPFKVTRVSEIHNGNEPETLEMNENNPCQNVYSVAKTFTMTGIGLLYDKGLVTLDEKICDIFSDELPDGIDERWYENTVEAALTHRLGLPGGFLDIDTHKSSEFTDDFLKYLFLYPFDYAPGTDSKYSDGAYYLLARICEKKTGMTLDNFLWHELLLKLDFQEMAWSHCPKGHVIGATGLYIHSSDMAKLGYLYLNGGVYKGERLLSEEWVKLAFRKEFALDRDETGKIYYKGGMCGQKLIIAPEQNRVVAMQSYGANSNVVADWVKEYRD